MAGRSPIEVAREELADSDLETRRQGCRRLAAERSPEAVALLIEMLRHGPSPETRTDAAIFLGHARSEAGLGRLLEHLRTDPEPWVRAGCALGLEGLGSSLEADRFESAGVGPALIEALSDPDPGVVRCVSSACESLELESAVPRLIELLEDERREVRWSASYTLVKLGARGERLISVLRDLSQNPDENDQAWKRSWLENALAELEAAEQPGEPQTPQEQQEAQLQQALELMESEEGAERRKGADLLHRLDGPAAVERLKLALEDPEPAVRSRAALALGTRKVREALPALIEHLTGDPSLHVRRISGAFIHYFEEDREQAVSGLLRALKDEDYLIVKGACLSLGMMGDRAVIPTLIDLLEREEWSVREGAAWALVKLEAGDQRLVQALEQLMTEPEAAEHDLNAQEMNADLDIQRAEAFRCGDPEPEAALTLSDLLERARELAGPAE